MIILDPIPLGTWTRQAVCADAPREDHALFWPRGKHQAALAVVRERYCDRCPVQADCLEDALTFEARFSIGNVRPSGIRAGHTGAERRAMIQARRETLTAEREAA